jgi:hypothetical protein
MYPFTIYHVAAKIHVTRRDGDSEFGPLSVGEQAYKLTVYIEFKLRGKGVRELVAGRGAS